MATSTSTGAFDNFVNMDDVQPPVNHGVATSTAADPLMDSFTDMIDVKPVIKLEMPDSPPEMPSTVPTDSLHHFVDIKEESDLYSCTPTDPLQFHDYAKSLHDGVASSACPNVDSAMESVNSEGVQQMGTTVLYYTGHSALQAGKLNLVVTSTQTEGERKSMVDRSTATASQTICYRDRSSQTTFTYKDVLKLRDDNAQLKKEASLLRKQVAEFSAKHKSDKIHHHQTVTSFVKTLRADNKKCRFYTSLYFEQIQALFEFLSPVDDIIYWGTTKPRAHPGAGHTKLKPFEELVMTLLRLRTGLVVQDMGYRFNISTGLITRIVNTWIQHAYQKFSFMRLDMAASRETIDEKLPAAFKWTKDTKLTIECVEFYSENKSSTRSSSSQQKQGSCCAAKAGSTFKILLACVPYRAVVLISDLFEGPISDEEMVDESKLPQLTEAGDFVLTDESFTVNDLTGSKNAPSGISRAPTGHTEAQTEDVVMEEVTEEEMEAENIDKKINVKHVVGRLKEFKLLQKVMPASMSPILSEMVFVCACLLNFQGPLPKKDENASGLENA